jgi:hypothetical protein
LKEIYVKMKLFSICYISRKRPSLSADDVNAIYKHSILANEKKDISGVLVEYNEHFLQYLEGPAKEVYALFEKIKNDERHSQVEIVQYGKINQRIFSGWNMMHKNLNNENELRFNVTLKESKEMLERVLSNKEFWQGIDVIEHLSNLKT